MTTPRTRFVDLEAASRSGATRLLWLALLVGSGAGCAGANAEQALADRVDAAIAPLVARHEFSGAVVLARGGRVVYQRGFGLANHAAALAFTPDTPADGGSLAKTFTAAGVWWLAHEGRIDADAPVTPPISPGGQAPTPAARRSPARSSRPASSRSSSAASARR